MEFGTTDGEKGVETDIPEVELSPKGHCLMELEYAHQRVMYGIVVDGHGIASVGYHGYAYLTRRILHYRGNLVGEVSLISAALAARRHD